jgi:hypothetical protein
LAILGSTRGSIYGESAGEVDYFVVMLDSDGTLLWGVQHGSLMTDLADGIRFTPSGDIVVAGDTAGSLYSSSSGNDDMFVAQLSATDGSVQFGIQWGTAADDGSNDLTVGAAGEIVVVGFTMGSMYSNAAGSIDIVVSKYGCPPGYSSSISSCVACDAGFFSSGDLRTECEACPAAHSSSAAAASCSDCSEGTYADSSGSLCIDCPGISYSLAGSDSCPYTQLPGSISVEIAIVAALAAINLILLISLKATIGHSVAVVISSADLLADIVYASTQIFYNRTFFVFSWIFIGLPFVDFVIDLYFCIEEKTKEL